MAMSVIHSPTSRSTTPANALGEVEESTPTCSGLITSDPPGSNTAILETDKSQRADKRSRGRQSRASSWANARTIGDGNMRNYLSSNNRLLHTVVSMPGTPTPNIESYPSQEYFSDPESPLPQLYNKKRKLPHQRRYEDFTQDDRDTRAPADFTRMFSTIIDKLDGQSSELAVIRTTQVSQNAELADIKKIASDLTTRVATLEEEVDSLKRAQDSSPRGQCTNPECTRRHEKHDKQARKNNIIISGLATDAENCLRQTRNFMENKFQEGGSVQDAYHIDGRQTILAKISTVGAKKKIMSTKNTALANTRIYIDNDQTDQERNIAFLVRSKVREGKARGIFVKSSYQSYCINDTWHCWNDAANDFVVDTRDIPPTSAAHTTMSGPQAGPSNRNPNPSSSRGDRTFSQSKNWTSSGLRRQP